MDFHPENYDVVITVPFSDAAGTEVTPSAASAKVLDGDGAEVVDLGVLAFANDATSSDVTIAGAFNVLPVGERFAIRILEVSMTFPAGTLKRRFSYAVEADVALTLMENTFMSFEYASLVSTEFVNKTGWAVSDEGARKTALVEAYNRLTRIPMKWNPRDVDGNPIRTQENVIPRDLWIEIDSDGFANFPTHFKRALRRAQFVEANELLQGDTISAKRRAGILAETIGESSMRISENMVDYGVSTETLTTLAGYIHFDMRIGRA